MTTITYNQLQIEEINRHKWIESEKAGYDIGIILAVQQWVRDHAAQFAREHGRG